MSWGIALVATLSVFLTIHTASAEAAFTDGNKLLLTCEAASNGPGPQNFAGMNYFSYCFPYIEGVVDILDYLHRSQPPMCIPSGVTAEQTRLVVIKYLKNHPEELHISAATLIERALIDAFPCAK